MSGLRPGDTCVAAAIALADAAVGWWEDHGREECHFCGVREDGAHDHGCPVAAYAAARGVRTSDPEPAPLKLVAQLAKDIITAVESHDTHRMQHIEQYARRIVRVAGGT